jgi:predicted phosphodiesterase
MKKILLLSDLHLEMHDYIPASQNEAGYDIVILAGDIHTKSRGVDWALKHFTCPVLYVLGNHEGYGGHWEKTVEKMRFLSQNTNISILHRDSVVIDNIRFLGCTGWSDFSLWSDKSEVIYEAAKGRNPYENGLRDYRFIRTGGYRRITPKNTLEWNLKDKNWLIGELNKPFNGQTVVITHHAPSIKSLRFGVREALDATDANNWDELVKNSGVVYWFHGHTHHPVKYNIGDVVVGSNPRGYPDQEIAHDKNCVFTINSNIFLPAKNML